MIETEYRVGSLWDRAYQTLKELDTPEGVRASSQEDPFDAIFGRDTAVIILALLRTYQKRPDPYFLDVARRSLESQFRLQAKVDNPKNGVLAGQFIHEYRPEHYEPLVKPGNGEKPWFQDLPNEPVKNYDSVDSTPLNLWASSEYVKITHDEEFLKEHLSGIRLGLEWILAKGNESGDGFIRYHYDPSRDFGGLLNQGWMDSREAVLDDQGQVPPHPIALVEVQAYSWLALKSWEREFREIDGDFAQRLVERAQTLKENFNRRFIMQDERGIYLAQAIDGKGEKIRNITVNPMLCLWAAYRHSSTGKYESVIDEEWLPHVIVRAFADDLFDPEAGLGTMSKSSPNYIPGRDSYHNGSFWSWVNGAVTGGLENFGFFEEARRLKEASLKPLEFFQTPIELCIKNNGDYQEYQSPDGRLGSRKQGWTAAFMLYWLS